MFVCFCYIISTYVLPHPQRDGTAILESVSPDGKELPGCQGRLQNPGAEIIISYNNGSLSVFTHQLSHTECSSKTL